jgi:hypothetical protein
MNVLLIAAVCTAILLVSILIAFFRRVVSTGSVDLPDAEWVRSYGVSRYKPMQRLLGTSDLEFIAAEPGYRPELGRKLAAQRRRIFRLYLGLLTRDFDRLCTVARVMMLHATEDRSRFAAALLRQRLRFAWTMKLVQFRLAMHALGLPAATFPVADVRGLVNAIEVMREQMRQLQALPVAS